MWLGDKKKVVIFTGCTGLFGSEFIKKYHQDYTIVGVARRGSELVETKTDFFRGDIYDDVEKIVAYVLEKYGRIDAVVNNAVFYNLGKLEEKTVLNFERELQTSLIGPLKLINTIIRDFWSKEGKKTNISLGRSITNISSQSSLGVIKHEGQATYSAIKVAINMLTKHMALEFSEYGVRVNALAPGSLRNKTTLFNSVEELKRCLDDASMNGEIRIVD